MSVEDAMKLERWFVSRGYRFTHPSELPPEAGSIAYWVQSNKHGQVTTRDLEFLAKFGQIALACGVVLRARGMPIGGRGFFHMDKAVINSCLNGELIELNDLTGVFEITEKGLAAIGLPFD